MDSFLNRKDIRQDQQDLYDFLPVLTRKKAERSKKENKAQSWRLEAKENKAAC